MFGIFMAHSHTRLPRETLSPNEIAKKMDITPEKSLMVPLSLAPCEGGHLPQELAKYDPSPKIHYMKTSRLALNGDGIRIG